jgi:hypothetical protein
MAKFKFDIDKANSAMLYICYKLGTVGKHKLMKILYFADQKHLVNYGRFISGDFYIAMPFGTVPSKSLDIIKSSQSNPSIFKVEGINVSANYQPDLELFSESELESLNESIEENKDLSFEDLTNKSHGFAWQKTPPNGQINIEDIAIEGGADKEMLKYISILLENQNMG